MYAIENETEIKIEYCETSDIDPLSDNRKQTIENNLEFNLTVVLNKNNNKEPEVETKWHKFVTNSLKYECKFCELSYSTIQTLRNHVRHKHPLKYNEMKNITKTSLRKKKLKCHICTKKFKIIFDLQNHVQSHGMRNIQKSCPICHALFESEIEILNHLTIEHKTFKKFRHICFICGYSTPKLSHYKQHENTHKTQNRRKCPDCDYSTNYPSNLRIHKQIHTNDKPYVCDYEHCDYRCSMKSALSSHKLKHDKEKNMLYCDQCSYGTVYKYSLKKHIDSHSRNSVRKR